jgi:hypothetical protein
MHILSSLLISTLKTVKLASLQQFCVLVSNTMIWNQADRREPLLGRLTQIRRVIESNSLQMLNLVRGKIALEIVMPYQDYIHTIVTYMLQ